MLGKKQSQHQKYCVSKALKGRPKSDIAKSNMSKGRANKILVSNNTIKKSLFIFKEELEKYLELGYTRGRLVK